MKKIIIGFAAALMTVLSLFQPTALGIGNENKIPPLIDRIDSELFTAFLESQAIDFEKMGVEFYRKSFDDLVDSPDLPHSPAVKVHNMQIAGPDGKENLRLRIYEPLHRKENRPGIYWIHGGGFLFGVPEQDEAQSLRFAEEIGAVVITVDYRKAPEYPFPAALEDSYAGLVWFSENARRLGVDPHRIAVAGASAGGGLCASVTLLARDQGGPPIAFQMPLYPMIDDRFLTPASQEAIDVRVWNNSASRYAWQAYLGDFYQSDEVTSYMAPAREEDLSGLPPAYSCVGNLDPFRDDTIRYMARLAQAGTSVEFHLYPGAYHAFEVIAPQALYSQRAVDEYVLVLRKALVSEQP